MHNLAAYGLSMQVRNELPGVPFVESPFFDDFFSADTTDETTFKVAHSLRQNGFAVIDFVDPDFDARADRVIAALHPRCNWQSWRSRGWAANDGLRIQDAWTFNDDVKAIATNPAVIDLLSRLYGRPAFPFQTLNFPVGTQQHYHSDSLHFSSVPERFMCGVWVALEDVTEENGPLMYYPGSHAWPIYTNEHVGLVAADIDHGRPRQGVYSAAWEALVRVSSIASERFIARKGQALIWAANLLHGGAPHKDPNRTRWSQVTHYYFDNCVYYTPMESDVWLGNVKVRRVTDISTGRKVPSRYNGYTIKRRHRLLRRLFRV